MMEIHIPQMGKEQELHENASLFPFDNKYLFPTVK